MARGEIPRHDNCLIKFSELVPYFSPNSMKAPFGIFADSTWKNHHAYYRYKLWNRPDLPDEKRDWLKINFRSSRYNRLMLPRQVEGKIHKEYKSVDPDGLEPWAAEAALRDFQMLDLLGAVSIGYNATKNTKKYYLNGRKVKIAPELTHITRAERLALFASKRESVLEELRIPEVTAEDVISSIIARYSYNLRDPVLREVAHERMNGNVVYPFDLPARFDLINLASRVLKQEFSAADEDEETITV